MRSQKTPTKPPAGQSQRENKNFTGHHAVRNRWCRFRHKDFLLLSWLDAPFLTSPPEFPCEHEPPGTGVVCVAKVGEMTCQIRGKTLGGLHSFMNGWVTTASKDAKRKSASTYLPAITTTHWKLKDAQTEVYAVHCWVKRCIRSPREADQ